jgi:hypothetical protein
MSIFAKVVTGPSPGVAAAPPDVKPPAGPITPRIPRLGDGVVIRRRVLTRREDRSGYGTGGPARYADSLFAGIVISTDHWGDGRRVHVMAFWPGQAPEQLRVYFVQPGEQPREPDCYATWPDAIPDGTPCGNLLLRMG